jgi:hypothetical protein
MSNAGGTPLHESRPDGRSSRTFRFAAGKGLSGHAAARDGELYIDRASLSVAMPLLAKEFSLSPVMQGFILSSFFWSTR